MLVHQGQRCGTSCPRQFICGSPVSLCSELLCVVASSAWATRSRVCARLLQSSRMCQATKKRGVLLHTELWLWHIRASARRLTHACTTVCLPDYKATLEGLICVCGRGGVRGRRSQQEETRLNVNSTLDVLMHAARLMLS